MADCKIKKGDIVTHFIAGGLYIVSNVNIAGKEMVCCCIPLEGQTSKTPPKYAHSVNVRYFCDNVLKVLAKNE